MDKKAVATLAVVSAVALISYQTWKSMNSSNVSEVAQSVEDTSSSEIMMEEKGSKYSAKREYNVHEDHNSVTTTVLLDGTTILDIQTEYYHDSPMSKQKQTFFDESLNKGMYVGQDITVLEIPNVTGATLVTEAFKETIKDITVQIGS